jgi:hypothetical protein
MSPHAANAARIVRAGVAYFGLVFGAGFVLGSMRVPFLVPRLGERIAELIETPFMFAVVMLAARYITRRYALPPQPFIRLGVGAISLSLLVVAELVFVAALQRRSVGEYIANKDPVAGVVFLAMLVLFALMPLILGRLQLAHERNVA